MNEDRFKFRAWDKEIKEILYFDIDQDYICFKHHENLIQMQSTGLKDKHGKLIFEGDILCYEPEDPKESPSVIVIVEWNLNGLWHFKRTPETFIYGTEFPSWGSEIIGNLYQHKELLETK